jgi:hypothetical protein
MWATLSFPVALPCYARLLALNRRVARVYTVYTKVKNLKNGHIRSRSTES